jgi:putative 4-mercaptohistidine N1-methyltranferase
VNLYESDELLQQYLIFHYALPEQQFPYNFLASEAVNFPQRCAQEGVDRSRLPRDARALDLGCSVGAASFTLSEFCTEVIGLDYSQAFIDAANQMKLKGSLTAQRQDEAAAQTAIQISPPVGARPERLQFVQGDAQALPSNLGQFDCVLACNLICRLRQPQLLLQRLASLLRPGGQLFITTPFTWMESFTPAENWLADGEADSFTGLKDALAADFKLEAHWDMPFLIREHARKYQYSIAQASRWIRR